MRPRFIHSTDDWVETLIRIIMFLLFVYILHRWIVSGEKHVSWGPVEYSAGRMNYYPMHGGNYSNMTGNYFPMTGGYYPGMHGGFYSPFAHEGMIPGGFTTPHN